MRTDILDGVALALGFLLLAYGLPLLSHLLH